MHLVIVFILSLIVYAILYVWWVRRSYKWADGLPTCEYKIPFLGIAYEFNGLNREERYNIMFKYAMEFPKMGKAWFGPLICSLYVHDPNLLQKIYTSPDCLQKPDFYRFFGWGSGLAKKWRIRRKMLNNAFTLKVLQSFIPIFDASSRQFCEILSKHLDGEKFNLLDYAHQATLDTICATSFGIKVDAQKQNLEFNKLLLKVHEIIHLRMFNLKFYSDLIFRFTKFYNQDKRARQGCVEFGNKLIEKRKKIYESSVDINTNIVKGDEDEDISKKPQIFVDLLLQMKDEYGENLSDEEIQHHVFTTVSAGNETTALLVSNVCLFLAIHPDVQERVVTELKEVFPSSDVQIDYDQLKKCTYLEMVIKETLRVSPSIPIIARQTIRPIELDGYKIPKGIDILFNIAALHRRVEDWGENAHLFNPDNFLPDAVAKRHPCSFMAFSYGNRNCIGQKYSMISVKTMLVNMLRTYKFNTHLKWTDIKWKLDIHLHITTPHWVTIEKRNLYNGFK